MSATPVAKSGAVNDGSGLTLDITITSTGAGHTLAVFAGHEGTATTITVAELTGGAQAFTPATKRSHSNGSLHGQWFYLLSCTGGVTVVRMTLSVAKSFRRALCWEISAPSGLAYDTEALSAVGANNTGPIDAVSANFTSAGTADDCALGGFKEFTGLTLSNMEIPNGTAATQSVVVAGESGIWFRAATISAGAAAATTSAQDDYVLNAIAFKTPASGVTAAQMIGIFDQQASGAMVGRMYQ